VIFVAHLQALPHAVDELRQLLSHLASCTTDEPGALAYSVRQDQADPTRFQINEQYRDREAWERHMAAPYVQRALERFADLLQSPPQLATYAELATLCRRK